MKKLMIAASAALCATVGFSDVTSANIVGYNAITPQAVSGGRVLCSGSSFLSVGGGGYCLKDFRIENPGGDFGETDTIAFMQADISKVDNAKVFYWDTDLPNGGGWAYLNGVGGHDEYEPVGAEELSQVIPEGTGFLCDFPTPGAKIVYSGEVNAGVNGKITCSRSSGRCTIVINPCPYDISLANVKISNPGGEFGEADTIATMFADISKVNSAEVYYWDTDLPNGGGWAYLNGVGGHDEYEPVENPSAITIKAGDGFLFDSPTSAARVVFDAPTL